MLLIKCMCEHTPTYRKGVMPWKYIVIVSGWTAVCSYVHQSCSSYVRRTDSGEVGVFLDCSSAQFLLFNLKTFSFLGGIFEIVYFFKHQLLPLLQRAILALRGLIVRRGLRFIFRIVVLGKVWMAQCFTG